MLSSEGIKREKGEGVKTEKQVSPTIKDYPKALTVNEKGDTMECMGKWHRRDHQEKGQLRIYQELLMGDVLNIQASIMIGGREKGGKDQLGTI